MRPGDVRRAGSGRERGKVGRHQTPLVPRPLFTSTPLTESLEQASCEFDEKRATKPKFGAQNKLALYFSQQLSSTSNNFFLLRDKMNTQGEKRETSTKTSLQCRRYFGAERVVVNRVFDAAILDV